jgi:uroporphyrinogen-III synthase
MRLIVTRPAVQAADWLLALRALGQDAVALPLIDISPAEDTAPLHAAWAAVLGEPALALVMFVSANAVQHFFALAPAGGRWPAGLRAAGPGPGTAAALIEAGVPPGQVVQPPADAETFDSETLWTLLSGEEWAARQVLVVRGEEGRDWLAETLRERGARVEFVAAYRRHAPQPGAEGVALLARAQAEPAQHLWVFSSSQAVGHLRLLAPGADWRGARALASHPRIAQAARLLGFGQVLLLPAPTPAAVAVAAAAVAAASQQPAGPPIESRP